MSFLKERGNDLETVSNSVVCSVFLLNNSLLQRYSFIDIDKRCSAYLKVCTASLIPPHIGI